MEMNICSWGYLYRGNMGFQYYIQIQTHSTCLVSVASSLCRRWWFMCSRTLLLRYLVIWSASHPSQYCWLTLMGKYLEHIWSLELLVWLLNKTIIINHNNSYYHHTNWTREELSHCTLWKARGWQVPRLAYQCGCFCYTDDEWLDDEMLHRISGRDD